VSKPHERMNVYGHPPEVVGLFEPEFEEYMHYMYLPIRMPEGNGVWDVRVPRRLGFASEIIERAITIEEQRNNRWDYVYLTARRGWATPGNPLNRPGWHSDAFGKSDINYVWTDRFPTVFAEGPFEQISDDHVRSTQQFEEQISSNDDIHLVTYGDRVLMRLDSSVIHTAPEIPAPGDNRSFIKVSFSNERWNLGGNSHNYLFEYEWQLFDRAPIRSDPARANADAV
jgi:hypothetical protein